VGLLPDSASVTGSVTFNGAEMIGAAADDLRRVRGNDISFIFQEPMTSLNPLHTVEKQILEALALHQKIDGAPARARVIELLQKVGIRDAETRLKAYPHQLSGGQRQRVMIAMALANEPKLLVADEPTTALDVTIQAQILELLADLKREEGMSMLFITHDLGIVRRVADRVCVMQHGEIVEQGPTDEVFARPSIPIRRCCSPPNPGAPPIPCPRPRRGPADRGAARLVSDPARHPPPHGRPYQGRQRRLGASARRRDAGGRRRIRLGQDDAGHGDPAARLLGRADRLHGPEHRRGGRRASCGRCARRCRSFFRTRSAASARA
jgi:ABC-type dipeptide/oligopeptide/nickel transport system ATPase subunit